jgi:predicted ArsR family transcriptional regulator
MPRPNIGAKVHADILKTMVRGPATLEELAAASGYLRTTVRAWVDEMVANGLAEVVDERKTRGARARVFAVKTFETHRRHIDFEHRPQQCGIGADAALVWNKRQAA